jgi:hypothetical protein
MILGLGVSPDLLSYGEPSEHTWCIRPSSDDPDWWEVFWQERGQPIDRFLVDSAGAAQKVLFGRLLTIQLLRGAL